MRGSWKARVSRALVLAVLFTTWTVSPAQARTAPPTLQGETFFTGNFTVTTNCNPDGISTIHVTATGAAAGPYPGTFKETATFTIAEQTEPVILHGGFPAGLVVGFQASFTIDSMNGTVTGQKTHRSTISPRYGSCSEIEGNGVLDAICASFGGGTSKNATLSQASANAGYTARINTADGVYRDTGEAFAGVFDRKLQCSNGAQDSRAFSESFYASDGLVPLNTPGQTQGGGQIQHPAGTSSASAVTFGLTAKSDGEKILGQCNVYDQALDQHLVCERVTQFAQIGNTAILSGTAKIDGVLTDFTIEVEDLDESGIGRDTFSIVTESGYSRSGVLTEGNIQVGQGATGAL